jgi:hypothetical protein
MAGHSRSKNGVASLVMSGHDGNAHLRRTSRDAVSPKQAHAPDATSLTASDFVAVTLPTCGFAATRSDILFAGCPAGPAN